MARSTHQIALAKIETVYGTDSVPANATALDVLLFREFTVSPAEATIVQRERVKPFHGNRAPHGLFGRNVKLSGKVPLSTALSAGAAPAWGPMMRACGMAQVIVVGTSCTYNPISSGQESVSMRFNHDGTQHTSPGARGTFEIMLKANEEPFIQLDMTGLYVAPTAVALPTGTAFGGWRDGEIPAFGNCTFTIGANNYPMSKMKYTHGNQVVVRDLPHRNEVRIVERSPKLEVTIDKPDGVTPENFFASAMAGTGATGLVFASLSAPGGRSVNLSVPSATLEPNIRYGRDGDVEQLTLSYTPIAPNGNDDVFVGCS